MKKIIYQAIFLTLVFILLISVETFAQDFKIRGRVHLDAFYGIHDLLPMQVMAGKNHNRIDIGIVK